MKRLLCLVAALLGLAGPASAQMAGGTAGLTVGNVGAHAAQVRTAIGAMSCPGTGSCAPRNTFLAALQAVAPSANGVAVSNVALDLETSLIIGSPAELEFGSGQVSSGGALASFIQGRYGITGPTMAAVFTAAGAPVNNNGTIAQFALPTLAQMLGLGVAPTANPTFTGTVTTALLSANGIGTGSLTAGGVTIGGGFLGLNTSGAGTDNNKWTFFNTAGQVGLQTYGDAGNGGNVAWTCNRNATVVSGCVFQAPLTATAGFGFQPALSYSSVAYGMHRMEQDLTFSWWDKVGNHILITNGGTPAAKNGLYDSSLTYPSFWQMEQELHELYWRWKIAKASGASVNSIEVLKRKIQDQWTFIQSIYPAAFLAGDGSAQTIGGLSIPATDNISDDSAWRMNAYAEIHEVTGDPVALYDLGEALAATAARWADPQQTVANGLQHVYGTTAGGLTLANGVYGMLYAAATDSAGIAQYGYGSSAYETWWAISAFYYYTQTGNGIYRSAASDTYNWVKADLTTPRPADGTKDAQFLIYGDLTLNPSGPPSSPQPRNASFGKPVRGIDNTALYYGLFGETVLAARLYGDGGNASYLADIKNMVGAIAQPNGYLRTVAGIGSVICNCRDPYTDGFGAPPFADEVLSLAGVDPGGTVQQMMINTAASIFASDRIGSAQKYTADWQVSETNPNTGATSWQQEYDSNPGVQGGWQQIQVDASTAAMARAGFILEERSRRK